jgi:hypothetical protein
MSDLKPVMERVKNLSALQRLEIREILNSQRFMHAKSMPVC